jgi:DNA-binding cell septation regulator SpoVG
MDGFQIRVLAIETPRKAHTLASVTLGLVFGDTKVKLADFRLLEKKDGNLWLAPPEWAESDGRKSWKYHPIVEWGKSTQEAVEAAVIAEWNRRGSKV